MTAIPRSESIPYIHQSPLQPLVNKLSNIPFKHVERLLILTAIACAVISLIPTLGWPGALCLRSVSCAIIGIQVLCSLKNKDGKGNLLLQIMRLASVGIGLAGVAANLNFLVIASIGLDLIFQVAQASRGALENDFYRSSIHLSFYLIDTFLLLGMVSGAWPFIVTAATLNSVVMFAFATKSIVLGVKKKDPNAALDAVCYLALGGLGIASAVRCAKLEKSITKKYHYSYKNNTDNTKTIYDKYGNILAEVKPGGRVAFDLDPKFAHKSSWSHGNGELYTTASKGYIIAIYAADKDTYSVITQQPMTPDKFPVLPVGASALATEEPRLKERVSKQTKTIALDAFLAPVEGEPRACFPSEKAPTISLKCMGGKSYTLDLKSVCVLSGFLRGLAHWHEEAGIKNEIELDIDPKTFELVMAFFLEGTIEGLETFAEDKLVDLHDAAEVLLIERLRLLCQWEISMRLENRLWKDTSLFRFHENSALGPLLSLFNFKP